MRVFALVLLVLPAFAQTERTFEVASVKLQPWTGQGGVGIFLKNDTLDAEHCSLNDLIAYAYNLRDLQLSGGPAWADRSQAKLNDAVLYQVMGKVSDSPPPAAAVFRQMLQALLADRFHLQVHHTQKDFPTFNLVVDKGGPKLKPSAPDTKFSSKMSSAGKTGVKWVATGLTIAQLLVNLEHPSGRPVFDHTGLDATYDFTLEFAIPNSPADVPVDTPLIFNALREQLGLRLESSSAPFDTVVVDHAEKPTEN